MKTTADIEKLLQKFKSGTLSPDEAKDLLLQVKKGDENNNLKTLLTNYWDSSDREIATYISTKILKDLKKVLNLPNPTIPTLKINRRKHVTRNLLGYAAVFFMATCITWLTKDYVNSKQSVTDQIIKTKNTEISVPYGSKSRIILPDGTIVNLNSGSFIKYAVNFSSTQREIYIEGEAFFDVAKDLENPFYVKTKDITVKVLGTKFNIKSYPEEKTVQTTLVSGALEIYSNKKRTKQPLITLSPNQQAIVEKETDSITTCHAVNIIQETDLIAPEPISIGSPLDMSQVIAWKDNRLTFRDDSFYELARKMERWYNVNIEIKDKELAKKQFSGVFVNETVEQALNALKMVTPFEYKMKKNNILITK